MTTHGCNDLDHTRPRSGYTVVGCVTMLQDQIPHKCQTHGHYELSVIYAWAGGSFKSTQKG